MFFRILTVIVAIIMILISINSYLNLEKRVLKIELNCECVEGK